MSTAADSVEQAAAAGEGAPARAPAINLVAVASIVVAGGLVLTGFNPLNTAPDRLNVAMRPALVMITPGVLLALLAAAGAWWSGGRRFGLPALPRIAWLCAALLLCAAAVSVLESARPGYSVVLGVSGLLAPLLIFAAVRTGRLHTENLAGGFLAAVTIVLLRADVVYVRLNGIPTSQSVLFRTKIVTLIPYDFHYYTLGNPDSTAGFLLLPFGLALFWAAAARTTAATRLWLAVPIGVIAVTLLLLYVRFAGLVALLMALAAFLCSPLPRRVRAAIGSLVLAATVGFAALSPGHYLLAIFNSGRNSSGEVRLHSVRDGWHALVAHPLTGVGLGNYGVASGRVPAHSSIVQAGAEMGILGAAAVTLITATLITGAARNVRRNGATGVRSAAWIAAACYAFVCAVSGVASEGAMIDLVSIYGLSLALMTGIAVALPSAESAAQQPGPGRGAPARRSDMTVGWWLRLPGVLKAATAVAAIVFVEAALAVVTHTPFDSGVRSQAALERSSNVTSWTFSSVPATWLRGAVGVRPVPLQHGVEITTTAQPGSYQLLSPLLALPAGLYGITALGRVDSGYMVLGALDVNADRWVNTTTFRAQRRHTKVYPLTTTFTLTRYSGIRIVLAKVSEQMRSRWLLRTVSFVRSPAPTLSAP